MGNTKSKPLNLNAAKASDANNARLFATFEHVWEDVGVLEDCTDAFNQLARLRRGVNNAPADIRQLAEVCSKSWDDWKEENDRRRGLRQMVTALFEVVSQATGSSSKTDMTNDVPEGHNTERLGRSEKKVEGSLPNMFGEREKHTETRAHHVPSSPACHVFWGMVGEAVSGFDMDQFDPEKKNYVRMKISKWLANFKLNLFVFAAPHNSFYDLLDNGQCVLIVPLLTVEEIAMWKQREPYEVLFICSSEQTHRKLGTWRRHDDLSHIKWENKGDLEKATAVLTAYVKALANSLNEHWDSYYDKVHSHHQEFDKKKEHITAAKQLLDSNNGMVEVPKLKNESVWSLRKKLLFKIDLGELYSKTEEKTLIPDPSLFAFKAAVNWSGRKRENRLSRKLLSCCSPEEESDEVSLLSGPPSISAILDSNSAFQEVDAQRLVEEHNKKLKSDLVGREVGMMSDSDASYEVVSDVSSCGST